MSENSFDCGKLIMSKPLYMLTAALCFLCLRHSIAEANSSICSPPSDCGNGVPVRYPFWVNNNNSTQEHCGYPGFGLTCSDHGPPIITLPSNTYLVTDINYDYHTLTLVDKDVMNQSCPRARHNISLGNFSLSVDYQLNVNLSFYFNCSLYNATDLPSQHIACLTNEGSKKSFVVDATYKGNLDCEEKVVVLVKEEEIRSDDLVPAFGEAMNKGFVLDWRTAMGCAECEDSGGFCGQNQINHQMLCLCSDGNFAPKSCSNGTFAFS